MRPFDTRTRVAVTRSNCQVNFQSTRDEGLTLKSMGPGGKKRGSMRVGQPKAAMKSEFDRYLEIGRAHGLYDPLCIDAEEFANHFSHRFRR